MSSTKAKVVLQASASNAAGAETLSSWVSLAGYYSQSVLAKVTNGATGPSSPCIIRVDLSPDGGTTVYRGAGGSFASGLVNALEYGFLFPLPADQMSVRISFSGQGGQAVTVQADITATTAL